MAATSRTDCVCRRGLGPTTTTRRFAFTSRLSLSLAFLFVVTVLLSLTVATAQAEGDSVAAVPPAYNTADHTTHAAPAASADDHVDRNERRSEGADSAAAVVDAAVGGAPSGPEELQRDSAEGTQRDESAEPSSSPDAVGAASITTATEHLDAPEEMFVRDAVEGDDEATTMNVSAAPAMPAADEGVRDESRVQTAALPGETSAHAGTEAEAQCDDTAPRDDFITECDDGTYETDADPFSDPVAEEEDDAGRTWTSDDDDDDAPQTHPSVMDDAANTASSPASEAERHLDERDAAAVEGERDAVPSAPLSEVPATSSVEGREPSDGTQPGEGTASPTETYTTEGGSTDAATREAPAPSIVDTVDEAPQQSRSDGVVHDVVMAGGGEGDTQKGEEVAAAPPPLTEPRAEEVEAALASSAGVEEVFVVDEAHQDDALADDAPTPASPPHTAQPVAPEIVVPADAGAAETTPHDTDEHRFAEEVERADTAFTAVERTDDNDRDHDDDDHDDDNHHAAAADTGVSTVAQDHAHTNTFAQPPRRTATPPSRLALSHLYYHALEALYVKENVTLFVQRARDAAPYGHARLNWLLGVLHAYGLGVPRSERDALVYYSFAAMEGVPEAHMALGYRYRNGLGVQPSCETALAHYREAADAVAMTYDGSAADLDGRPEVDVTGARTIASGAGGGGGGRSLLSFFTYRDNLANSDKASRAQRDLLTLIYQADRGSGQALLTLGYIYLKGSRQVRRDGRRAETYLKQAAAKGIAEAHGALGNLYTSGDASIVPPLPRDLARAHHHYRLGAAQRDPISLNGIGFLHAIGYLEKDTPHNAAVNGGASSKDASDSTAHPPDFETAARYFERGRSAESIYNLAVLHLYGRGVAQDRAAAQRLFWNAAHGGSVLARWQLAHLIEESMEQNPGECVKAVELYREVASYGSWHRGDVNGGGVAGPPSSTAQGASPYGKGNSRYRDDDGDADGDDGVEEAYDTTTRGEKGPYHDGAAAAAAVNTEAGPSAPRTDADYARLLQRILHRLQAVEETLRVSDSEDGPAVISIASFVEMLSLAETGDAASTWLAAQFVEDFLEVEGEAPTGAGAEDSVEGAVALLWPSGDTDTNGASSVSSFSSRFLSPAAARSELLHYVLQRTVLHPRQKGSAHGAAYLRLGDFFYHGEAPQHGLDMSRAMAYYRLAADICHHPQALFNVGFMYQLGLHHAPRATLVSAASFANERAEQPGTIWKIHSDPPYYLTGAPSTFLTAQAAAHAWNRDSNNPMSRAVDVYLAWKYYTESLRREGRGWMAVQAALLTLNVQWSLRHFGLLSFFAPSSSASLAGFVHERPSSSSISSPSPSSTAVGDGGSAATFSSQGEVGEADTDAVQALMKSLTTALRMESSFVYTVLAEVAADVARLYAQAEQVVLYGAVGVFVLALLVRHHAL